ncbi:MAG: HAMP domain-containing protein, partial [Planctomycetota bacterium]
MSYQGFKRVLGETSLERKCRWWFGVSLCMLLVLSFSFYSKKMQRVVEQSDRKVGPELVRATWLEAHSNVEWRLEYRDAIAAGEVIDPSVDESAAFYNDLTESNRALGSQFESYVILPQGLDVNPRGVNPPEHPYEEEILAEALARQAYYRDAAEAPPEEAGPAEPGDMLRLPDGHTERAVVVNGEERYRYYQPLYAERSCVLCHKSLGTIARANLMEGDLMGVVRVEIDREQTNDLLATYTAWLWVTAIVIGVLSMFLLYFIVRYVIVKPVQHLRDVANAVREGDVEQRADINTGDEFEELAAAFNRMLRRLLRQQDALQEVNGELDSKVDQLAQANLRLFEMNRVKSDFLATMSHELRTPLNSILGFSEVLGSIDTLDDKQRR